MIYNYKCPSCNWICFSDKEETQPICIRCVSDKNRYFDMIPIPTCPLEDCNKGVIDELEMPHHILFTCRDLHEVLCPKHGVKTESSVRCVLAAKGGFEFCKECEYNWCKFNENMYKDLEPEKVNCPVCGEVWDDDQLYCKTCIIESRKEHYGEKEKTEVR